ncbi:MAG TPA: hypothetical protein VE465_16540 [Streptosporangiaceae bacterium]|jgi:hypothetical protein|nr:hypothetical protein [Streptosporangiaceae bacterium]
MITSPWPESAPAADRRVRRRRTRPSAFSVTIATVTGIVLLLLSVPNLASAIRAARAEGTPGTFVAAQRSCVHHLGHESCSWRGTFTSFDGRDRQDNSYLYGDVALRPGQRVQAMDVGRSGHVYTGPSREWILTTTLLVLGIAFILVPLARTVVGVRRERSGSRDG